MTRQWSQFVAALCAAVVFSLWGSVAQAMPMIGLTTSDALIQFDSGAPATLTAGPTTVTGLQTGETLLGIDVRPSNRLLYAIGSSGRIYILNPTTGAATFVATLSADPTDATNPFSSLSGTDFGMDFNPVPDRIRLVSDTDQNLRINPDTGEVTTDAPLAFAAGDTNAGDDPTVTASAYTNSFAGATSTTLYGIDVTNHVLVTQNPPNNGTLNTVGSLLISDSIAISGFDIAPGSNRAFGTFTSNALPTSSFLYEIDLSTGSASVIDQIGPDGTGRVRGLAIAAASTIQFSAANYTFNENAGTIQIPVFRTGNTDDSLSVDYTTSDGTATAPFDYVNSVNPGTLGFGPGQTNGNIITIAIKNNPVAEGDETFTITLSNIILNNPSTGTSVVLGTPTTATVTIIDGSSPAAQPTNATIYGLTINNRLFSFQSSDPGSIHDIRTFAGVKPGDNLLAIDFRPATGQLYGLGSDSRLYTIDPVTAVATPIGSPGAFTLSGTEFGFDFNPVVDRIRIVSNTGQNLRLNPNDGTLAATDTSLSYATDTDGPGPNTGDINAGTTPTIVDAAYTIPAGAAVTTLYDIDSGLDTLTIQNPPNNGTLTTVGLLGLDTSNLVGFDIAPGNAAFAALTTSGGFSKLYTINLTTGTATNQGVIDFPDAVRDIAVATFGTVTSSATSYHVNEAGGAITIPLTRTGSTSGTATVDFSTTNGTATAGDDYGATSGTVTFAPGQTTASLTIPIFDDTLVEGNEVFNVTLSNPQGVGLGTGGNAPFTIHVTINDDDAALTLRLVPAIIAENGGTATGIVERNTATTMPLVVNLLAIDAARVTLPPTVTIPAGQTRVSFSISAVNNAATEGPQTVRIAAGATGFHSVSQKLVITDDEARLTFTIAPDVFGERAGSKAATGTITRNTPTSVPLVVALASGTSERVSVPAYVVIPVGATSASFFLRAVNNTVADGPQRVKIAARATGFPLVAAVVTVLDDEARLSLSFSPDIFSENANGVASLGTITRNTPSTIAVSITLQNSDTSEVRMPSIVTIPAGQTSTSFAVTAVNDSIVDGTQLVNITASATGQGYPLATAVLRVTDDDGAPGASSRALAPATSLSTALAAASQHSIVLTFSGALDANTAANASHYAVTVNGVAVEAQSASYKEGSVTLTMPTGALHVRDKASITYNLLDGAGRSITGSSGPLTAH